MYKIQKRKTGQKRWYDHAGYRTLAGARTDIRHFKRKGTQSRIVKTFSRV
jgi:hypothetical protein